jgi:hypothetical protein
MLRVTLSTCLLLAGSYVSLAAQTDVGPLRERSRSYLGCYELRLFDWNGSEGEDAAESIPARLIFTATILPPRNAPGDSSASGLDLALGPFPGYSPSDFIDERWSLSSATDSVVLTWSNERAGVQAFLALRGSVDNWRITGRTAAWSGEPGGGAPPPASVTARGRAAGRSVDCDR